MQIAKTNQQTGTMSPAASAALAAYQAARGMTTTAPPSGKIVILVDVSGSMIGPTSETGRSKHAVVLKTLKDIWTDSLDFVVYSFGGYHDVKHIKTPAALPGPSGGTPLSQALRVSAGVSPGVVLVISDGIANNPDECFTAAAALKCPVSTLYIGPEDHEEAREFMRLLASKTGGKSEVRDLRQALAAPLVNTVKGLLPG